MVKKIIITACGIIIASFSVNAQKPRGVQTIAKKEITSPDKHKYSDVQNKYQNQIVFSKTDIKKDKEDPAAFVNTWQMGEMPCRIDLALLSQLILFS